MGNPASWQGPTVRSSLNFYSSIVVLLSLQRRHRESVSRMPCSATCFSKADSRCLKEGRSFRSQMERTPDGETKMPRWRSSLLVALAHLLVAQWRRPERLLPLLPPPGSLDWVCAGWQAAETPIRGPKIGWNPVSRQRKWFEMFNSRLSEFDSRRRQGKFNGLLA